MLRWRLTLGVTFIAAILGASWLDATLSPAGLILGPLAIVLAVLATQEVLGLLAAGGVPAQRWVAYLGSVSIIAASFVPYWLANLGSGGGQVPPPGGWFFWPMMALALTLILSFLEEMRIYHEPGHSCRRIGGTLLAVGYVGVLLAFVAMLRLDLGPWEGLVGLASLVAVVKCCDTGAYTVGRLIGRHKLIPRLSPGKTIEGLAGGLAFACVGSWLSLVLLPGALDLPVRWNLLGWLGFGVVIGAVGVLGDLAESLIKRDMGRKDSSTWMPGFGGVLDILDSILLAAPPAYLLWVLVR